VPDTPGSHASEAWWRFTIFSGCLHSWVFVTTTVLFDVPPDAFGGLGGVYLELFEEDVDVPQVVVESVGVDEVSLDSAEANAIQSGECAVDAECERG
jgi:hypothetical protein